MIYRACPTLNTEVSQKDDISLQSRNEPLIGVNAKKVLSCTCKVINPAIYQLLLNKLPFVKKKMSLYLAEVGQMTMENHLELMCMQFQNGQSLQMFLMSRGNDSANNKVVLTV